MRRSKLGTSLSSIILTLATITLSACEVDMTVSIDGRNPPTFALGGSGRLISFAVSEVPLENQRLGIQRASDRNNPVWFIEPAGADNKIRRLPVITYGKVPTGFIQKFPASGSPPPALVVGKIYEAGGPAYGANGGFIWFKVEGNKAVRVPVPGRE